ncbi:hypothetical protein [Epibacterium ulvae]|uniref:hypothetical protein n=1 Tax=Epibacterium ulvae TaxID=1156985 RepID=UPI00248F7FCE|nr:hypothetical protein [Epibacterium ulvae]
MRRVVGHTGALSDPRLSLSGAGVAANSGKKWWRVRVDDYTSSSQSAFSLDAVELRSIPGGADVTASDIDTVASRAFGYGTRSLTTGGPGSVFSGASGDFWNAAQEDPERAVGYRFAEQTEINEVVVTERLSSSYTINAITVQSSADGETWRDEWSEGGFGGLPAFTSTRP